MGRDSINRQNMSMISATFLLIPGLRPLEVYGVEGSTLYILVPSEQMTLSYISKKYYLPLKVAIAELTGTEYEIKFILPEQTKNIRTGNSGVPKRKCTLPKRRNRSNLNPNYTFDTFVVGSNNRFAQSASLAVAESPGEAYNPLYIYGGPGLGKTHLMHSIGHFILERNPERKSICMLLPKNLPTKLSSRSEVVMLPL